jgi:hypothetical protein
MQRDNAWECIFKARVGLPLKNPTNIIFYSALHAHTGAIPKLIFGAL